MYLIKVNCMSGFYYSRTTDEETSIKNGWSKDVYYIETFETIEEAKELAEEIYSDEGYTISNVYESEPWTPYEDNLLAENQTLIFL